MWKAALLAAMWLPAAGPHGAHAMTLAELTKASAVFSDMIQKTLQITASAERRIGQANAEMDVQVRGPQLSPEEIQQVFGRVDGHLRTARAHLAEAKGQTRKLVQVYQRQLTKERKGRRAPPAAETEEDRLIMVRYSEAYREAETRSQRAYERAKLALMQAEERFLALKKTAGGSPGN